MAKEAKRTEDRIEYQNQEKIWLQMADQAEAYDKANRGWEASQRPGRDA